MKDSGAFHAHDREHRPFYAYLVTSLGHPAQSGHDQTRHRVKSIALKRESHALFQILHMNHARDDEHTRLLLHYVHGTFVLVANLAKDFFQQILDGDKARHGAEFIHHDGHLRTGPLQIPQQFFDGLALGHELRGLHEVTQIHGLGFGMLQQVLQQQHAHNLVYAAFVKRNARVAAFSKGRPGLTCRSFSGKGHQSRSWRHHFPHHGVAKAHDIADKGAVGLFENALGFAFIQQRRHRVLGCVFVIRIAGHVLCLPLALKDFGDG